MPTELEQSGVRFHTIDRADTRAIGTLVGDGVDLLVDTVAFTARDVRALIPVMSTSAANVLISSRAVYVDGAGRHLNGLQPPRFDGAIAEDAPTLPPAAEETDPFSRAGYGRCKVAAERVALDSGSAVSVLRPSKVHGRWARNPRTAALVAAMRDGVPAIELADRGGTLDHLTAAANTAALVEVVADAPGARILNTADPDTPTAAQIVRAIAAQVGWAGRIDLLEPGAGGGEHPWYAPHPVILDTSAAARLSYRPVGTGLSLIGDEVSWITSRPATP
jgi:nucleoside-diphosphate-sugar epimerase